MSVLLFPPPQLRRPAILTAWAAVSVCETIRQITGLQARIKWPNDVLLKGKKVCGILIEQGLATVAGLGLNVNQPAKAFDQPGLTHGASLRLFSGNSLDCTEIARRLIFNLDEEHQRLNDGDLSSLEVCWKWRLGLLGRSVAIECVDRTHHGRLRDVTFTGLHLESADGKNLLLAPESVQHLGPAGNISS
jgi:BirA family biotin operon repressor/biotin-[acetyl-CoA-carboxylase] ligase